MELESFTREKNASSSSPDQDLDEAQDSRYNILYTLKGKETFMLGIRP
jgi:hypothetical protein